MGLRTRIGTRLAAPAAILLAAGCGYIGEPQPPLANVPERIADLAALQRGEIIIAHFTVPQRTTEGVLIKDPVKLDLRIGTFGVPFNADAWAAGARSLPPGSIAKGLASYEIPVAEWVGKEAILAARAIGANGKQSSWSSFVTVPVVPPPDRPAAVTATATAEGVVLAWRARGQHFRVFRKTAAENLARVADVEQPQWTDTNAEFGKSYTYVVQTVVKLDNNKEAESDLSGETSITPEDRFPPAVPSGLRAVAAPNSIELSWEGNTEPDLAGYRLYRALAGGPFERIAEVSQIPTYSDRNVEPGKVYRYAISAFDKSGNESLRTAAVEVAP